MGTIAARVRRARLAAGLTQADIATAVGVCRGAVAQWENVDGTNPTPEHLTILAAETRFRFEWIATGRGSPCVGEDCDPEIQILGIAETDLESRMLAAMKVLCQRKQELAVKMVAVLVGD